MRMFLISAFLIVVAMRGSVLIGQQLPSPPITFREGVDYVQVDALVTDRGGNIVRDLTKADFEIFENGKSQTVEAFSLIDLPIQRPFAPRQAVGSALPPEADVATNLAGDRVYVMVLDDLHM